MTTLISADQYETMSQHLAISNYAHKAIGPHLLSARVRQRAYSNPTLVLLMDTGDRLESPTMGSVEDIKRYIDSIAALED